MTKAGERLIAAAKEAKKMRAMTDDAIELVARAILKARFFDAEPEMYGNDVERFHAEISSEHFESAKYEARAAIEAMQPAMIASRL